MTTVAYMRVSSRAQDLGMQGSAIQRACGARGDEIVTWYAEKASARTLARPELARLRADARAGLVRRVYVYRLDRLARSGIRDLFEVVEELRRCGCEVVSIADGFALDGPAAEIVMAVLAWAAQAERLAINERIASARERAAEEGRRWGRPPRLTDLDRARVRRMRAEGRSIREIAMALKVPRSTRRACRRWIEAAPCRHRAATPLCAGGHHWTRRDEAGNGN